MASRGRGGHSPGESRGHSGPGPKASLAILVALLLLVAGTATLSRYLSPAATASPAATPGSTSSATSSVRATPTPQVTSELPLIAWTDATPAEPSVTPMVAPTRPPLPECRASQLSISVDPSEEQSVGNEIAVLLTTSSQGARQSPLTCYLWGAPKVSIQQGGQTLALRLVADTSADPARPVVLLPGDVAWLPIVFSSMCHPDRTKPMTVAVRLPSGSLKVVVHPPGFDPCDRASDVPATLTVYPFTVWESPPPPSVAVTLELPEFAIAGQPMSYAVLVTNIGDAPIPLDPCPAYAAAFMPEPGDAVRFDVRLLNCEAIGPELAAHTTVHLAMVYQVLPNAPLGRPKFVWAWRTIVKGSVEIRAG